MKKKLSSCIFILLFCGSSFTGKAQVFHFQNQSTTIIKTTAQSPAHWYLEIYNDVGVDTLLRWKADCTSIPAGWTINFDDQNANYANIQTGDSADFILLDSLALPQKLIIGAATNNIAATASVLFDIYNPADSTSHQTIEYQFIITQATGTFSAEKEPARIHVVDGKIVFSFQQPTTYQIVSVTGQQVSAGTVEKATIEPVSISHGIYFVYFFADKGIQVVKVAL